MIFKKFKSKYFKNYLTNYFLNTNFYSIFLLKPLKHRDWNKTSYTNSHFLKGEDYHKKFDDFPGRKIIWKLEKKIINFFIKKFKKKKIDSYLDFASGTGRIAKFLEKRKYKQYLLDSSPKMLNYAKTILKKSIIINKDFNKKKNFKNKFDLITAFRFFPNAEPELRKKAFKFLYYSLKKDGILIFNNHRNFWSIPYFIRRMTFRSDGFGLTHNEIIKLIKPYKFKIMAYKSIGLLTDKENSSIILWSVVEKIENIIFKLKRSHRLGYNVIYVIKKF